MRKIFVFIVGLFVAGTVFAVGENVPTSKSYVDTAIAQKQDTIPANAGAAQVLTNTGTPGEYGTKNIYDSSADYAGQTDALVTAGQFNTAVQNAINAEFVCIDWDARGECLLMDIRGTTAKPSGKNLFNLQKSNVLWKSLARVQTEKNSNGYTVSVPGTAEGYYFALIEIGAVQDFAGKTLTLSATPECINDGRSYITLGLSDDTGTIREARYAKQFTIPENFNNPSLTKVVFWLYVVSGTTATNPSCTYTNIQVEEGSVATEYEPYQNLYLPSGN